MHATVSSRAAWVALGAILVMAGSPSAGAQGIRKAPAFVADELLSLPARNWITNGGNIYNQRYSTLDQINRDNIDDVKAVWRVSLNGSGLGPGYSAQAQALFYEGVIYVVTGDNDVFAVEVETGKFLWTYEADVDFDAAIVCCGRLSRGLGMGDGKIFLGRLDGRLIALDQHTGKVVWNMLAGDPALGYGITAAPLYYDGKVITGFTGGEYAARGRVSAYDADSGEQVWNFHTVPGPGEIGHATWPQDNDAWKYGGAPVWQTPSIDPDLGMVYFSTGNAGPDLNGAIRAGDNLFAASILALDVKTGEYRWHFQVVRHDIWDYDAPNPTILFDAEFDGIPRKGIAQVSKAGFLYILDRTTGVPLTPVVETPVPQDAIQATAATQPIPQGDWVIRHDVDVVGEDFEGILRNGARTFTPFNAEVEAIWRPFSGVTWNPSSYNVQNNLMYICAGDGPGRGTGGDPDATIGPEDDTRRYVQGSFGSARDIGTDSRRTLVAMNLTNHKVAWRRLLDTRCAGTVTTAGGLIIAGRYNGELTALNSDTGQRLWSFQTDGGFTTTATTFEHEGVQYLTGIAGGGVTGGRLNDGLWLFSLNGTIDSLPPGSGDAPPDDDDEDGESTGDPLAALAELDLERSANLDTGAEIYGTICETCHGPTGQGGTLLGAPLPDDLTVVDIVVSARSGIDGTPMPPFASTYSLEELHDVASYIRSEILPQR
ncbi:PQQ-binding-like beta-propeller repeat protein [Candidatus Rariloculus sp.]|uniref:outer membrane protein assembly factor BamB family protein n=1 Tax=Candidatus Rariloculus sp. TaxID=3101265 RepID=UPI003D114052